MLSRNVVALVAVTLTVSFTAARPAPAQPLADRLPADTVVYLGWAGADLKHPGFSGSHLQAMLESAELPRVVNEIIPKLIERAAQEQPQVGGIAEAAMDVLRPMWRHPTALYVGPVNLANINQPVPRLALICDAGDEADAMQRRLDEFLKQAGAGSPVPIAVRRSGNVVAVVVGKTPELDAVLDGKAKGKALASAKNFTTAMSMQKSPVLAAYVDAEAVVRLIDEAVAKGQDAKAKTDWPKARDALGLRGLKRLSLAQGFDGKDWGTRAYIEAPAPRTGLVAALQAEPVSDDVLRAIPSTATVAGVARADLAGLVDAFRGIAGKLDPQAAAEMEKGLKELNGALGLDVRRDVLAPLGDQWAYYVAPELTGRGPLGIVVVNRLKDAAKAEAVSDKLKELATNAIARENKDPNVHITFKQAKVGDVTVHYLATPLFTPSWAIQNGNLYVSLYPQVAAQAAGHVSREGKSILDNAGFVALRKRLGGERATSFQFFDLPKSAPTSYQVWLLVSSLGKVGDVLGVDTPAMLLPPLGKLIEHLSVGGSVSWVDQQGWHFRAVTPFPAATTIASETAGLMDMQTAPLMASILLPSLNRAREQANRIKSANNLKQIGLATQIYANDHKGMFPKDLGELLAAADLTASAFVNPRGSTAAPPQDALTGEAGVAWVRENSDYEYRGAGKRSTAAPDEVLAHEKPEGLTEGLNILFVDGRVQFFPTPEAQEIISRGRLIKGAGSPGGGANGNNTRGRRPAGGGAPPRDPGEL